MWSDHCLLGLLTIDQTDRQKSSSVAYLPLCILWLIVSFCASVCFSQAGMFALLRKFEIS